MKCSFFMVVCSMTLGSGFNRSRRLIAVHFLMGALIFFCATPVLGDVVETQRCFSTQSPVLAESGDLRLTIADVIAFLDDRVPAEHQAAVVESDDRFGQIIRDLMITQELSSRVVESEGYSDREEALLLHRVNAMLRSLFRDSYLESIELEDYGQVARELYLTQPSIFSNSPRLDLRHLLVNVEPDRSEADAMRVVLRAIERVEGGESFESVVREVSDDPNVQTTGGMLREVVSDDLVSQLGAVLAESKEGELTDPVRSRFGWHVAQLVKRYPGETMSWEEAEPLALQLARENHFNSRWERKLRDLMSQPIEVNPDSVEQVRQMIVTAQ